jgi:4'-phosphopantetheinyl transferase
MAPCEVYLARRQRLRDCHYAVLDEREAQRSARFRQDADRARFVLGAVLLKAVAGRHAGIDAAAVTVDRTCTYCGLQHGRPLLPGVGLEASVSHSGDVVAVAVTAAGPVGVDVELIRPFDVSELTPSVCTPAEQAFVRQPADFYAYWTRKEAVLKATGAGLRMPMTEVSITPPAAAPSLLALGHALPPPCRMADVPAGDGYAGAVAVLTASPVAFSTVEAGEMLDFLTKPSAGRDVATSELCDDRHQSCL